jgi:UDP-galactopyranose mutase
VHDRPRNLEEHFLNSVGRQIYEMFFQGYSTKQWNKSPSEIAVSTAKRIPIRYTWNDRYFDDPYEGIPIGGYTKMFENMIDGADLKLGVDYFDDREEWNKSAKKVVYTGKIDEFFDYRFGELEYRSLRFEEETLSQSDYQGIAIMNYTNLEVPYTRIVEHKHFEFAKTKHTVITKEYPDDYDRTKIPYYPVSCNESRNRHVLYQGEWDKLHNMIGGGRLFDFSYYNMDQTIASALSRADADLKKIDISRQLASD